MYTISLNLEGKSCVVIGGGKIAYAKIGPLLDAKADVAVVSPHIIPEIAQLWELGAVEVSLKEVENVDYEHAFFIIAATNDPELNHRIYEHVKHTKLVNVVSDVESGNVHIPATLTRGRLQISVSTGGASPILAKRIRNDLQKIYDESYDEYLDFLFEIRMTLKKSRLSKEEKRKLLSEASQDKYRLSLETRQQLRELIQNIL